MCTLTPTSIVFFLGATRARKVTPLFFNCDL